MLRGLKNLATGETTLAVSPVTKKTGRMRTLRSGAAAERERVQREDHQSHHLQVHHQSLHVVTRKKKSQEDLDRAQRRKGKRKGTGQEQSTPAATTKRIKVPSPCLNSLAVLRADDRSLFEDTVVWEFKKMSNSCFATHSCITLSEHKFVFFTIITTPFSFPFVFPQDSSKAILCPFRVPVPCASCITGDLGTIFTLLN